LMRTIIGVVVICLLSTHFAAGQCTSSYTDIVGFFDRGGPDQDIARGINNGSLFVIGRNGVTLVVRGSDGWGALGVNPPPFPADGTTGRIAVGPNGTILARDSSAHIWTVTPGAGSWTQLPGVAADVAITSDGTFWSLNMTAVTGGFQVQVFNGSVWTTVSGSGSRIAGGPDPQPWVVGDTGHPWHRNSNGMWTEWTGLGWDIGIDDTDHPWVIGDESAGRVWHWNSSAWVCDPNEIGGSNKNLGQNPSITGGPGPLNGAPSGSAFFIDNGTGPALRPVIHQVIQR
jgi:hypothetical protein